jgi:predicted nuclease of predicted toxin-antitoxin system
VAGREALFTDACVNGHLVDALVLRGWDVMRAIDVYPEKTPDPIVFERAAREGRVFVTNDEGILEAAAEWLEQGRPFRMIFWPQEDYRAWTIGELVGAFEDLAAQDDPFLYPLVRLRPRR